MASLSFHFSVFVFCASLLIPTSCLGHLPPPEKHAALFVFGDSIFDAGNSLYINLTTVDRADTQPYGKNFFGYPTGRFSDGRLIPDFIAEYAKLSLIPPFLQPGRHQFTDGVNFATAGAGALDESHPEMFINLNTQLSYFKKVKKLLSQKLGAAQTKNLLSRAVYLFSSGGNDYLNPSIMNSSVLQPNSPMQIQFVEMVIGNLTTVIKEIYKEGGRKFGLLSMDPLGCLPGTRGSNGDCMEEAIVLAKVHNRALYKVLQELERELEGFKYSYFDFFTSLTERIDNPTKYGFKEGKTACCGTGPNGGVFSCGGKRAAREYGLCDNVREYVFFDSFHSSERANQQCAELMWNGAPHVAGPYNLKELFELTHVESQPGICSANVELSSQCGSYNLKEVVEPPHVEIL